MYNVLLTCVGGELAPLMIKQLQNSERHNDLRVIGVDGTGSANGRHVADHFEVVPMGTETGYTDEIIRIVRQQSIDLLVPTSDEEALALSEVRGQLTELGCTLGCAEHETLVTLADKGATFSRLRELGVPVPDWCIATTPEELEQHATSMLLKHEEIAIKPVSGRGGRGVCIVTSTNSALADEAAREQHVSLADFLRTVLPGYNANMPAMIMPRLEEPVHDLDMLGWEGEALRLVPRRRVNSALPNEGHVIMHMPELIDLGKRLVREFGLSWLYDCDIMFDRSGQPYVLEINPRQSGSVAVNIVAGVPLLDDVVSLARGQDVPDIEIKWGTVIVPYKSLTVSAAN